MKSIRPGEPRPFSIAHRGASSTHPENTRASFDEALRAPIDGIEFDVQPSRDGVPVLYHDRTLRKLGGGGRRVSSVDAHELLSLDAGEWLDARFRHERMPTLDEVLDLYGGKTLLLIEIKLRETGAGADARLDELARRTVSAVILRKLESSVLVLCFDLRILETVREADARVRTVINLAGLPRTGASTWKRLDPLFAVSVDIRALSARFVDAAHEHGKPVFTYTCNTPRTARKALHAGADALMSDRPDWLCGFLAEQP